MLRTEYEFRLPIGYVDAEGELHRDGVMRLATAADEIHPLRDPRVRRNEAYLTVIVLSDVLWTLGDRDEAMALLQRTEVRCPNDFHLHVKLSARFMNRSEPENALTHLKAALAQRGCRRSADAGTGASHDRALERYGMRRHAQDTS